ncbi:MAG: succinate dehydrogenase assembly factor 2 [Rubricella sp.]
MNEETREIRLKRLRMRAWHRGTKEMDMILGPFSDTGMKDLDAGELDLFEELLTEYDQDLYAWFSGQRPRPEGYRALMDKILPIS